MFRDAAIVLTGLRPFQQMIPIRLGHGAPCKEHKCVTYDYQLKNSLLQFFSGA